jgi:hypothetical protein
VFGDDDDDGVDVASTALVGDVYVGVDGVGVVQAFVDGEVCFVDDAAPFISQLMTMPPWSIAVELSVPLHGSDAPPLATDVGDVDVVDVDVGDVDVDVDVDVVVVRSGGEQSFGARGVVEVVCRVGVREDLFALDDGVCTDAGNGCI